MGNKYDACIHHYWHVWNSLENLFRKNWEKLEIREKIETTSPTPLSKVNLNPAEVVGVMEHREEFLPRDLQLKTPVTTDKIA